MHISYQSASLAVKKIPFHVWTFTSVDGCLWNWQNIGRRGISYGVCWCEHNFFPHQSVCVLTVAFQGSQVCFFPFPHHFGWGLLSCNRKVTNRLIYNFLFFNIDISFMTCCYFETKVFSNEVIFDANTHTLRCVRNEIKSASCFWNVYVHVSVHVLARGRTSPVPGTFMIMQHFPSVKDSHF